MMDYLNVKASELASSEEKDLRSAELEVRKQIAELKLDVYDTPMANSGKVRKLRKTLARIKTVLTAKKRALNV
jgi:ribosomal protein L29